MILDHDDTAVDSTATIHFPAHLEVMRQLRPDYPQISLEEWYRKNFDPGIMSFLTDELSFSEHEIQTEYKIWREYTSSIIPSFYPGFLELLVEYRKRGGIVAVISHSEEDLIKRDYQISGSKVSFIPDKIMGWNHEEAKRKPSPYPVFKILEIFNLNKNEALIVDDLKPGVLMAKASGVEVVAAGWGHNISLIKEYMIKNCLEYFSNIGEFAKFILIQ